MVRLDRLDGLPNDVESRPHRPALSAQARHADGSGTYEASIAGGDPAEALALLSRHLADPDVAGLDLDELTDVTTGEPDVGVLTMATCAKCLNEAVVMVNGVPVCADDLAAL